MAFQKITESESLYDNLDQMSVRELLEGINNEDRKVAIAVGREIPKIEKLVTRIVERMRRGGRLFYIGAGTSGRLGVLDASEIPPTYGMPNTLVIGLIAGGDRALRNPVESAEDDLDKAWEELQQYHINTNDTLVGIAASGTTPYVIGALRKARSEGILTVAMRSQPISDYYSESTDIAEIHSMSMEQFAYPYAEWFFGDQADKFRFAHLQEALTFVPFGVAVDEFQHICYAHPELTPKERTYQWHLLEEKYMPCWPHRTSCF